MNMKKEYYYETVTEALNDLSKRGYTHDFNIKTEKNCIICNNSLSELSSDEFEIDETYRFEGDTDPGDEMIIFAISSKNNDLKGTLVNAYGIYSDTTTSKIVEKLATHIGAQKPLKRAEFLIPLSREHHHGLLLCWKIKTGFSKGISTSRIKAYADWFFKYALAPHFEMEEKHIFPILGNENNLVKQAIEEHSRLTQLFSDTTQTEASLQQIQVELAKHIRFEERVLFNEIQYAATTDKLESINQLIANDKFIDNTTDAFWE